MFPFIALLLAINAFFAAAEFALVRLQAAPAHRFRETPSLIGRIIRKMLRNVDAYLSTLQIGITSISLALGSIGEPYVAQWLLTTFGTWFPSIVNLGSGITFAITLTLITVTQIIVAEQAPKSYGIKAYEKVMAVAAIPLEILYWVCFPLVWFIHKTSVILLKLLGVYTPGAASNITEEELRLLLIQSTLVGSISEKEHRIMANAMHLEESTAYDLMVPRPDVITLDRSDTVKQARALILQSGHSRIPVVDPDLDHCIGILYAKDLLADHIAAETEIHQLVREPVHIPETISLEKLLYFFQSRGLHLAITIDEFGGASGIVTLEDVLEALVGDIKDEFDRPEHDDIRKIDDTRWRCLGQARLDELEKELAIEFETEQDTLNGWFIEQIDGFAKRGDHMVYKGFQFSVESVERHRIVSILVKRMPGEKTLAEHA